MDPDIKAKWIAALRGGKYRQAEGRLHKNGAYCCLGVLCLAVGATFTEFDASDDENTSRYFYNVPVLDNEVLSEDDAQSLSCAFLGRLGLPNWQQSRLVNMNDDQRASFSEIANYIEQNL